LEREIREEENEMRSIKEERDPSKGKRGRRDRGKQNREGGGKCSRLIESEERSRKKES